MRCELGVALTDLTFEKTARPSDPTASQLVFSTLHMDPLQTIEHALTFLLFSIFGIFQLRDFV